MLHVHVACTFLWTLRLTRGLVENVLCAAAVVSLAALCEAPVQQLCVRGIQGALPWLPSCLLAVKRRLVQQGALRAHRHDAR